MLCGHHKEEFADWLKTLVINTIMYNVELTLENICSLNCDVFYTANYN